MTATTQDRPTAQRIATGLVTAGLRAIFTEPVVEAGEEFYAKEVRVPRRGDSIDGLVRFNAVNDGTGEVMAVAVMVHATPLPGVVDRCTVYGYPRGHCSLPVGHDGKHVMEGGR